MIRTALPISAGTPDPRDSQLRAIFNRVHACRCCPGVQASEVPRCADVLLPEIDTLVLSQSPARNFVRRSGLQCFDADGNLGTTGRNFEKFLNKIDRTLQPPRPVTLGKEVVVAPAKPPYRSIYFTDLVKCFPGKRERGQGDRQPSEFEVETCLKQGFLGEEFTLLKPRLIMLMGKRSWRAYAMMFLKEQVPCRIQSVLDQVVKSGILPRDQASGHVYLPVHHSSGVNMARFKCMLDNDRLCAVIREHLRGQ
jgi:hypothetical protein